MKAKQIQKRREYLNEQIAKINKSIRERLSGKANGVAELNLATAYQQLAGLTQELDNLPSLAPHIP